MPKKNNAPIKTAKCHPDQKHFARDLCRNCYDREYSKQNREKLNKRKREWNKNNPERRLAIKRKSLYGIDDAQVRARLNAQDGLCKICQTAPATHLDHNHSTDVARSLLCGNCNRALGLFKENPVWLRRAAEYLELWDDRAIQVIPNTGRRADGIDD